MQAGLSVTHKRIDCARDARGVYGTHLVPCLPLKKKTILTIDLLLNLSGYFDQLIFIL